MRRSSCKAAANETSLGAKAIVSSNPSSSASNTQSSSSTVQSSSAVTSTTSTNAIATALSCPASDGQTVTIGGKSFLVECGIDHVGGDLTSMSVSGLNECISNCASNPSCVDVSLRFVLSFLSELDISFVEL